MTVPNYRNQLKLFLSEVLSQCMETVNAERGSIFILDEKKEDLVLEIIHHHMMEKIEGMRTKLGDRIAGKVALEEKAYLVKDINEEISLSQIPRYKNYRSPSFISLPIKFNGRLIGVLNISDKKNLDYFDENDLQNINNIIYWASCGWAVIEKYVQEKINYENIMQAKLASLRNSVDNEKKFSSLGKLVGGIVHEINNPLDGVMRYINLALDKLPKKDSQLHNYLKEAQSGLNRIAKIVNSLLTFCWSFNYQKETVDIHQAIDEVLFSLREIISKYNIKVKKHFLTASVQLPDYQIKLAFTNIIKNACEAMEKGGYLLIRTRLNNDVLEIKFSDNGIGMPKVILSKIFDPFFTTKEMGRGAGLGLAITNEIIQRYEGTIKVDSQVNKGTEVTIYLPLKK